MRPGIGFPSFGRTAVWSGSGWSASYPAVNAAGIDYPSRVARASAAGAVSMLGVFPASVTAQIFALCQHNLQPGDTFRLRGYAVANPTVGTTATVFDTAAIAAYPGASTRPAQPSGADIYGQHRPILLGAPVTIRSLNLDISAAAAAEVGYVEAAVWWEWPGISPGRSLTVDSRENQLSMAGGATRTESGYAARQVQGAIDAVLLANTDPYLDFQQAMDTATPFLFVHDIDDPISWSRTAFLATNVELPALAGVTYRADRFPFRFNEHLR